MIDPNWCWENPEEAAKQMELLSEQNCQLKDWQQEMVAKAADQSLEGYRELAERLARVEEDRDEWKAQAGADAYIASLYREDAESRCAERKRLEAERDALAAHVERVKEWWGDDRKRRLSLPEIREIIESSPTTSLARRDAVKGAGLITLLIDKAELRGNKYWTLEDLKVVRDELRRQAEEDHQ